ncbi:hypothetical protein LTS08_001148 [Lithohypha guttulata]|nr:hypothetical protein LTS08_001148 [Lithohypha guttulata]
MSSLINKAKDALNPSASSTVSTTSSGEPAGPNAQKEDYVDKGLAAAEQKMGYSQSKETNEKITDAGRGLYEKQTGSKVSDKQLNSILAIDRYDHDGRLRAAGPE